MSGKIGKSILIISVLIALCLPVFALAADTDPYGINATAGEAKMKGSETDLPTIIGNAIGAVLSLVGVIFLVLMVYGGISWMLAGGNEEKVGKAKNLIINSIIGIVIIFAAYAITYFVTDVLLEATAK